MSSSLEDGWFSGDTGGTGGTGSTPDAGWNPMGSDGRVFFGAWMPRLQCALAERRPNGNSEGGMDCGDLDRFRETAARATDDFDMFGDLESMVEMLTEVNTLQKDLFEDAVSKVDAAKEALEALRPTWHPISPELSASETAELESESILRKTAPSFVPGEEWSGKSMSGFND